MKMRPYIYLIALMICVSCSDNSTDDQATNVVHEEYQILNRLSPGETGVDFRNDITTNEVFNTITFDNLFLGSGVGIIDVNNDGLMDIYFGGSMVGDRLYLNKGDLKFEDITESSGITGQDTWSTGVAIADVNEDGYDDIYVCKFIFNDAERKKNLLFINQKDNTFKESADKWGVADPGYGIMANFFDYDEDGDLDLYVGNQPPSEVVIKNQLGSQRHPAFTDRLYRNDGKRFTNVTGAAGVTNFNYTLSTTCFDYNNDGKTDIFVASDYEEPDYLWENNGDGTFTNRIHDAMQHLSNFSMGSDIADINRDGRLDLYTVDMSSEDSYRQKTNMSGMNPEKFWNLAKAGFHYQYMYNAMHLNNGDGTFSEIAHMSGISSTDWSWAPLFVDFDLDGWDDLFVTNGILKEVRNNDYNNKKKEILATLQKTGKSLTPKEVQEIADETPSVKILNALYRNNGDMTFEHKEDAWGVKEPSWSQGAAYADLDNDGDLDIVVSNVSSDVDIYENRSADKGYHNYLNIQLKGGPGNPRGFGSRIMVYTTDKTYVNEMTPFRGYMSTSQSIINCGLGRTNTVDSVIVIWPDGRISKKTEIESNQTLTLEYKDRGQRKWNYNIKSKVTYTESPNMAKAVHVEDDYDDYIDEILIPHKMSTLGPHIAVADVNGDGSDDFYLAGPAGQCGQLWLYTPQTQRFTEKSGPWCEHKSSEDGGAHFFDADNDGDQDLIVTSGGNQDVEGFKNYEDRLYINDGNGNYSSHNALNGFPVSTGCISTFDFDEDGDQDVFIGGRQIPSKYGFSADSRILKNEGGLKFSDVTDEIAPFFKGLGMVTDAIWTNIDAKGDKELVIVGEWMPISVFRYSNGAFENVTESLGLSKTNGWWNHLSQIDIDGDGQDDYLVGNVGLNIKYKASSDKPFKVYVDDFDENGTNDVYLGQAYRDGNYYPIRGRTCSSQQMPFVKKEFKNYDAFAKTTFEDVLGDRIDSTTKLNMAYIFESVVLKRNSEGGLDIIKLPNDAQISPIFDGTQLDVNNDGKPELALVGNYYNREVETTRSDASYGLVLSMKDGSYVPEPMSVYGLDGSGDVRAIKKLKIDGGGEVVLIAVNNEPLRVFVKRSEDI